MSDDKLEEQVQKMEANNGKRQEILAQMEQQHVRLNNKNGRSLFGRDKRSNTQSADRSD